MRKLYLILLITISLSGLITANTLTRNVPSSVQAEQEFQITYSSDAIGKWGVIIVDGVSGGCQFPAGTELKSVMLSNEGNIKIISVSAPSSGSCTFHGDYNFVTSEGEEPIISFKDDIIRIIDEKGVPIPEGITQNTNSYQSTTQTKQNSNKGSTFECINGIWRELSIEPYCNDVDENLYIDESGLEHCRPSSYPSVNDGSWCSKKETITPITGEFTQTPKLNSNNFLLIIISITTILIVSFICLTIVLTKRKNK